MAGGRRGWGVGLGGGTICGLSAVALNTDDIHEIAALSRRGDVAQIDLRIGDLAKEKLPGLNLDVTASNFAKADAQSNPEDVAAAMKKHLEEGKDILFIGFSSGLSASCQNERIAAEEMREVFPDRKIVVVDSLCASMGQGLLVHRALKL